MGSTKDASNAVGIVGELSDYTISKPPYVVKTCDQVLQIEGKVLDTSNYSIRTPGFMTLSIYFVNFFKSNNASQLIESMRTPEITNTLSELGGAPGCTMFKTLTKEYFFCFDTPAILKQMSKAMQKFMNCAPDPKKAYEMENALANCDLSKADLGKHGPFGKAGKKIKKALEKIKEKKEKKNNKNAMKGVNPYYMKKGIPGDQ